MNYQFPTSHKTILSSSNAYRSVTPAHQRLSIKNAYLGTFPSPLIPCFIHVPTGVNVTDIHNSPFPHNHYSVDGLNILRRLGKHKLRVAILLTVCREILRHGRSITVYFDPQTERLFRTYRPQELVFYWQLINELGAWFKVAPRAAQADTHVMGEAERRNGICVSNDTFADPSWYVIRFPFITHPSRRMEVHCHTNMLWIGGHTVPLCHNVPLLIQEISVLLRASTDNLSMAA